MGTHGRILLSPEAVKHREDFCRISIKVYEIINVKGFATHEQILRKCYEEDECNVEEILDELVENDYLKRRVIDGVINYSILKWDDDLPSKSGKKIKVTIQYKPRPVKIKKRDVVLKEILDFIDEFGDVTCYNVAEHFGYSSRTAFSRLEALVKKCVLGVKYVKGKTRNKKVYYKV